MNQSITNIFIYHNDFILAMLKNVPQEELLHHFLQHVAGMGLAAALFDFTNLTQEQLYRIMNFDSFIETVGGINNLLQLIPDYAKYILYTPPEFIDGNDIGVRLSHKYGLLRIMIGLRFEIRYENLDLGLRLFFVEHS